MIRACSSCSRCACTSSPRSSRVDGRRSPRCVIASGVIGTGERGYRTATEKIEALEKSLGHARTLRARSIERMRLDGYSWARIEEITGLTRQRLNAILRATAT